MPYKPADIATQAIEAAEAGAAILHLHARQPNDGRPTGDPNVFAQFLPEIHHRTNAVINITTGGSAAMAVEERLAATLRFSPELCSMNMGSMNFAFHGMAAKPREWKFDWEKPYIENSERLIFRNTFADIARICELLGSGARSLKFSQNNDIYSLPMVSAVRSPPNPSVLPAPPSIGRGFLLLCRTQSLPTFGTGNAARPVAQFINATAWGRAMTPLGRQARIAGSWFFVVILTAPLRLVIVPDQSARDILDHLALFRAAMVADLVAGVAMLFLTFALRTLLLSVHRGLANTMVILGGILPAALYVVNVGNDAAALLLAKGAPFLDVFNDGQRMALAELFLRLHDRMVVASELFWGLWLVPLGVLVRHSGYLPRLLGWWLLANGVAYVAQCVVGLAFPTFAPTLSSICAPIQFGEIVFALWLVIMGARPGFRSAAPS